MFFLNLTLSRLSVANVFDSHFLASSASVKASNAVFRRSFYSAFYGSGNLDLKNSLFTHFLSPAVFVSREVILYTMEIESKDYSQMTANRVSNKFSDGGGAMTTRSSSSGVTVKIAQSTFQTCSSSNKEGGGAIYIGGAVSATVEETRGYYCTAPDGAFLVATGSTAVTLTKILTSECSPGVRPASRNAIHVNAPTVAITQVNVTNNAVMGDGAGILIESVKSVAVTDFVAQGVGGLSAVDLDFPAAEAKLLGVSVIDSRMRTHGAVAFFGDYVVEYGCYLNNTGDTIFSRLGIVTFKKCWFDKVYFVSPYVRFEDCTIELNNPELVPVYTGAKVVFSQTPWVNLILVFADQEEVNVDRTPYPEQTRGFAVNAVGGLAIAGALLLIFVFLALYYFVKFVGKYRQREIHRLHQHYAEGVSESEGRERIPIETIGDGDEQEQIDYNITLTPVWDTDDEFHGYAHQHHDDLGHKDPD